MVRRLKNDFKGTWTRFGRSAEHAEVTFSDQAVARGEIVDRRIAIARQDFFRRLQGWFHDVLRHLRAEGKGVKPGRVCVGMERDQAVETERPDLPLKEPHLGLVRAEPEFPVQIASAPRMTCAVLEARRIAERIDVNLITPRDVGIFRQLLEKPNGGKDTRSLVAMNTRKNADAEIIAASARPDKKILFERILMYIGVPSSESGGEPWCPRLVQRGQRLAEISLRFFFQGRIAL